MFVVNEKDFEYRFGDSGPKYLMKGPRMNYALVQFQPGQDFQAHYHNVMEENFYILEGKVDIVVDNVCHTLTEGDFIHIEPRRSSLYVKMHMTNQSKWFLHLLLIRKLIKSM